VTPLEMKPLTPKALAILQAMRDAVEIAQGRDVPEYHGLNGYLYHRTLEAAWRRSRRGRRAAADADDTDGALANSYRHPYRRDGGNRTCVTDAMDTVYVRRRVPNGPLNKMGFRRPSVRIAPPRPLT
jgi:hypothetical protein